MNETISANLLIIQKPLESILTNKSPVIRKFELVTNKFEVKTA